MRKYLFTCKVCSTVMSIETELEDSQIHSVPPCPCGKSRMISLNSDEYKYGTINGPAYGASGVTGPQGLKNIPPNTLKGGWDA